MTNQLKTILYVDDDADDRELLSEALQIVAPEFTVLFAENGLLALEQLNHGKDTNTLPCLIVLDLNMPYLDGRQTFERLKTDPRLKSIPLVVLTTGDNPNDKTLFGNEGVPYYTKPIEFSALEKIASEMKTICD